MNVNTIKTKPYLTTFHRLWFFPRIQKSFRTVSHNSLYGDNAESDSPVSTTSVSHADKGESETTRCRSILLSHDSAASHEISLEKIISNIQYWVQDGTTMLG